MTKEDALKELKKLQESRDAEADHMTADEVLLKLIDDEEISEAFEAIEKWYA